MECKVLIITGISHNVAECLGQLLSHCRQVSVPSIFYHTSFLILHSLSSLGSVPPRFLEGAHCTWFVRNPVLLKTLKNTSSLLMCTNLFLSDLTCGKTSPVYSVQFFPPGLQDNSSSTIHTYDLLHPNYPIPKHLLFPFYCDFSLSLSSFSFFIVCWFGTFLFHLHLPLSLLAVFNSACMQLVHHHVSFSPSP